MQSPCNPLIEDYTEIFYMIDEEDIPSIRCKMSLRRWLTKKSELTLLYDWQFNANQFVLASSPLRLMTRDLFFPPLSPCGNSPYVRAYLTRRCFCLLWLCLAFHHAYVRLTDWLNSRWFFLYNFSTGRIENTASNNSSVVGWSFVTEETCLPCRCLSMDVFFVCCSGFHPSYHNIIIKMLL
jgi:hypothetical protein